MTHSGVMRVGAAPGSLAGGPGSDARAAEGAQRRGQPRPQVGAPRPVGKRRIKAPAPGLRDSDHIPASLSWSVTSVLTASVCSSVKWAHIAGLQVVLGSLQALLSIYSLGSSFDIL